MIANEHARRRELQQVRQTYKDNARRTAATWGNNTIVKMRLGDDEYAYRFAQIAFRWAVESGGYKRDA